MLYFYKVYGMSVQSEIELPEVNEIREQEVDVIIQYGIMPEFIKAKKEKGYVISGYRQEYKWFYIENQGDFLILNGNQILVSPLDTADEKNIRAILLGACMGSIMYQKELLSIHGSSILWRNKAVVISGQSGAGKSTIAAEFGKRGCMLLADDTVVINQDDITFTALPAYPQQKLCEDCAVLLGYDIEQLICLNEDRKKYAFPLNEFFCNEEKELSMIVCLGIHKEDTIKISVIDGSSKLEYLLSSLYSMDDFNHIGMPANIFRKCLKVADKVPMLEIVRPAGGNYAPQIAEKIIEILESR